MNILVTGATGYIGGRLVPLLFQKGHDVTCLARHPDNLASRPWRGVHVLKGDALREKSFSKVMQTKRFDVAYYLIHSMRAGVEDFDRQDRIAARNFAEAAKKAGVGRIIYLGGLGLDGKILSPHLRSRHEVGEILRASGVPVTEFRAAVIVGSGSISFEMIRYLTERLPIMICPQWVTSVCQPISVKDVLRYLTAALDEPRSWGKILEIGGGNILTYKEMMLQYAAIRGLKRRLIKVPFLTPHLSSYWIDFITPIPSPFARALIEGLRNNVICHDHRALEIFPQIKPMKYKEAVRIALERMDRREVETIWHGSHASSDAPEPVRLETKEGMILEKRQAVVDAPPDKIFKVIEGIGADKGWFYADWAWKARGLIDRMIGGVGMRRGRRHPEILLPGDALDFWRVEDVQKNRLLRLRAEMKVPGKAWLQFEVAPWNGSQEQSLLTQTAFFEPKGLAGFTYWYALYPIHTLIFSGMCQEIKRRSEIGIGAQRRHPTSEAMGRS